MGGYLAGMFGAIGDHLHEQQLIGRHEQEQTKANLLENYKTLLSDPHMADVHGDITQALLGAAQADPAKLSKLMKPGGKFDPAQWQTLAYQRQAGLAPSPANQQPQPDAGNIPPPPVGQMQHEGGGSGPAAQMGQPQQPQQQTIQGGGQQPQSQPIAPPPPATPSPMGAPDPQSMMAAGMGGAMHAQAIDALPPSPGSPAPSGAQLASPMQAAATMGVPQTPQPQPMPPMPPMIPPPPGQGQAGSQAAGIYQGGGSLTDSELRRRKLADQGQQYDLQAQAQGRAQTTAKNAEEQYKRDAELAQTQAKIQEMRRMGIWDQLSPREQAAFVSNLSAFATVPRPMAIKGTVSGSNAHPGQIDAMGNPVDPKLHYSLRPSPTTGETEWTPVDVKKTLQWVAGDDPQKLILTEIDPYDPSQNTPVKDLSKYNPSMIPQVRNSTQWKQVQQADGSIALVPVTVQSGSQRVPINGGNGGNGGNGPKVSAPPLVAPPASAPPAGSSSGSLPRGSFIAGERAFTPEQAMNNEQKANALGNTIDLVHRVQQNMGLLGNLIDAKKIELQIDPQQGIFKSLINRGVNLTPGEAQMAADFASLMEHINTLRGPLGATGFRGEEAFSALQAQRGQLMANPAVTSRVLANTLQALNGVKAPLDKANSRGRGGQGGRSGPGGQGDAGGEHIPPPPADEKVSVKSPEGKVGKIPKARLQDYLDHGYVKQ